MTTLNISGLKEFDDHELVIFATDRATGLKCFIAIHNTNLGPATGGTRYLAYTSEQQALKDALSLSRAMTYKCALAGVPYGGGKAVIIADKKYPKNKKLLQAYAKKINLLNGYFTTGEDVGIVESDVLAMQEKSAFINGKPNLAGDLAPWAALGVAMAMKPALKSVFGSDSFAGRTFAIKGLGKVGLELCNLIIRSGGIIFASDINPQRVKLAKQLFPQIKIVSTREIQKLKVDVFSPCALGGDLTPQSIAKLQCRIVCGAANNQLVEFNDGKKLHKRGILYIPDYVANAGGLINVAAEMDKRGYNRSWAEEKVRAISDTAKKIIELSHKRDKPTSEVANMLAEEIFKNQNKNKFFFWRT